MRRAQFAKLRSLLSASVDFSRMPTDVRRTISFSLLRFQSKKMNAVAKYTCINTIRMNINKLSSCD